MTQPVQTSFLLQTVFSLTTASLVTGCTTEATGGIVGAGVIVLGAGAWAAHRYLTRLRGSASSAVPPAAAVLQQKPVSPESSVPQASPVPPTPKDPKPTVRERLVRERLVRLYPVFGDASYGLITKVLIDTILEPSSEPTESFIEEKVQGLVKLIESRRGIGNPKEEVLLRILRPERSKRLERSEPPPQTQPAADPAEIEKCLSDPTIAADLAQEAITALLHAALKSPKAPAALRSVAVLSGVALSHFEDKVSEKAADALAELARFGSQETSLHDLMEYFGPEDRAHLKDGTIRHKDIQARYVPLITSDVIERLRKAGLKSDRDFSVAMSSLSALKSVALLVVESEVTRQAVDALSIDGLYHQDPRVATLAAKMLAEIANKDHSRIPMLPLVGLRLIGLRTDAPRELALAFLEAMVQIAAPSVATPGPERKVSEKALQLLFDDALPHSDPEIAKLVRTHLRGIYTRRPDLFSEEMRETLATSASS
jgi:hypothetical protein